MVEHLYCPMLNPSLLSFFSFTLLLLQDRIEIIEGNIAHRPDIILSADAIIMNNVFEFFMEPEQQISVWRFLRQTMKSGTLLVTIPSLEETFSCLQVSVTGNL
jgi:hypothetical protein